MRKQNYGENKKREIQRFHDFKGIDYAHSPANVSPHRAVSAMNMVRSEVGKVCKRTGYRLDSHVWSKRVNGVHFLNRNGEEICLVHSGNGFYVNNVCIYSTANDDYSRSVQMGNNLYIVDGKAFMRFDGQNVHRVQTSAYVPQIYTARAPRGGGRKYEQENILTPWRKEGYKGDGVTAVYVLAQGNIGGEVSAVVIKSDGTSYTASAGNGLSVDTVNGRVTFASAPPMPRNPDEDNVFITYKKSAADDRSVLDRCTVISLFGAGGRPDTLFLSGNPDHPGREWFSQPENPAFFGRQNTDVAGSDNSTVMGYSVKGDSLFVHRKNGAGGMNISVRRCSGGDSNFYSYPVENSLQGPGTVAKNSFVNMANDALFLTENGIYAITESETDGRHFTQMRSFYINPSVLDRANLSVGRAVAFNDFYVLALGRDIYLLDTLQKSYEEDKEYSKYQYESYHWQISEDIRLLFVQDGRLCFATESGKTGRFYTDYESGKSFSDRGNPVEAHWQTGDFNAGIPHRVKNIHRMWVMCAPAVATGVQVLGQVKGMWKHIFTDYTTARFFKWSGIVWSKFTWSPDRTPKIMSRDVKLKNLDKMAVRLENNNSEEPFGIYEMGFEYTTGAHYR